MAPLSFLVVLAGPMVWMGMGEKIGDVDTGLLQMDYSERPGTVQSLPSQMMGFEEASLETKMQRVKERLDDPDDEEAMKELLEETGEEADDEESMDHSERQDAPMRSAQKEDRGHLKRKQTVAPKLAIGGWYSTLLRSDGTLWATGKMRTGDYHTTTIFPSNGPSRRRRNDYGAFAQFALPEGTVPQTLDVGDHSLAVVMQDQTLWTVGYNPSGNLGLGDTTNRFNLTQVLTGTQAVAMGRDNSVVLKADGTVWTAGDSYYGQLGNGVPARYNNNPPVLTYAEVASGAQAVAIAAGYGKNTGILKDDGTVWMTGRNRYGEHGDGTTSEKRSFAEVFAGAQAVAFGEYHSTILAGDGKVWTAGRSHHGQLGSGDTSDRSTFAEVFVGAQAVDAGYYHTAVLKADGTVWMAGSSQTGRLGDGSRSGSRTTFHQVFTGAQAISMGRAHSAILAQNGSVWTAGIVQLGSLGWVEPPYNGAQISNLPAEDQFGQVLTVNAYAPGHAPAPTPAPAPNVAAVGDPHLTNLYGQHFDLMQPGLHVFAHIPRHAAPLQTLLKVEAEVQNIGGHCADMYIQDVNVTGKWASEQGMRFQVGKAPKEAKWHQFHIVQLKVKEGVTKSGVRYLNVLLRHLDKVNYPVGGLLGSDDHTSASTPAADCRAKMVL